MIRCISFLVKVGHKLPWRCSQNSFTEISIEWKCILFEQKKKGVSLKQKWVSFKTKNNSTRDFACPRSRLAQARLSNFVFLFLFEPWFFALSFTLHFAPIQTLLCTIFLQEKGRKAQCYFENTLCLNWKPYSLFISCYKRKFC